jgi:hypothetical protein
VERLPMRYRIAVWVTGVACFAGLGAWSAASLSSTTAEFGALLGGALLGGLLGALLVLGFLHALERSEVPARPVGLRSHSTRLH